MAGLWHLLRTCAIYCRIRVIYCGLWHNEFARLCLRHSKQNCYMSTCNVFLVFTLKSFRIAHRLISTICLSDIEGTHVQPFVWYVPRFSKTLTFHTRQVWEDYFFVYLLGCCSIIFFSALLKNFAFRHARRNRNGQDRYSQCRALRNLGCNKVVMSQAG